MYIKLEDVLDALEREVSARWPACTIYRNVMPKNFARPSFYVELVEFTMKPEAGTPASVSRNGKFRIVAFETVDEYHNSQVSDLDTKLDKLAGIFAQGWLAVCDRAPHAAIEKGQILSTDAAELTISLSWLEDLADYAEAAPEPAPIEHVRIEQN
ncbi:MAG: hypothetical protein IKM36_07740 [Oscillospiraceae bacterium]|nr:hypothetical protein [Oscillospiraceae bacterium]MBR2977642.1 hypothetical protein [Oscillospiraceae bacterium]MBR3850359.1 hypothetical protein [Oscillospiraceae bacterium]